MGCLGLRQKEHPREKGSYTHMQETEGEPSLATYGKVNTKMIREISARPERWRQQRTRRTAPEHGLAKIFGSDPKSVSSKGRSCQAGKWVTTQLKTSAKKKKKKKTPSKGTERKLQDARKDLWLPSDRALRAGRFKKLNHLNSNRNNMLILTQVNALNRHFPNYKLASPPDHPHICAYINTHRHINKNNKSFLKN